jgi:Ca2+-binding RTX toxin-like protein
MTNFIGGSGRDVLKGTESNDLFKGNGDVDRLFGFGGNDTILGGADTDQLEGGNGRDLLVGGPGYDWLRGGRDADTFKFYRGDSYFDFFTPIADLIIDFEDGVDHIDVPGKGLRAVDLTKISGGTLVEYHGGSFGVRGYRPGDWSNDDFI